MVMWDLFKKLSFRFFKKTLEPYVDYFESLKPDIQKANIPLSLTEYVYIMFFVTMITFLIEFPLIAFIAGFFMPAAMAFFLAFTTTAFFCLLIFFVFYSYPSFISNMRGKNIDAALPFATTYLATIAGSRAPPTTMFKVISQFEEYGELAKETKKIYRDVEMFSMDLPAAMRKTASRTPSLQLKELLWGLTTVLLEGSDLAVYLREKSKGFMTEYRRRLEEFSHTLSVLIEIYLTLIIVGSIFFVIMTALMTIFGGGSSMNLFLSFLQFVVIFIVLPFVSIGFIIFLKTISPSM